MRKMSIEFFLAFSLRMRQFAWTNDECQKDKFSEQTADPKY